MTVTVPPPRGLGRDSPSRRAAREALVRVLWKDDGNRRLPGDDELARAVDACDRRDTWWVCETASAGPVYFLPTREWVSSCARLVRRLGARRVLEVGAGDGFLARCLRRRLPGIDVIATDSGAWSDPRARMNTSDRREFAGVPVAGIAAGDDVERLGALAAVRRYAPDIVVTCWVPPGLLVERMIRSRVRFVLDIGVDGDVCGNGMATWRFEKEFLSGALESRAFCRLDHAGAADRRTRVTLYAGRAHPGFHEDRRWARLARP